MSLQRVWQTLTAMLGSSRSASSKQMNEKNCRISYRAFAGACGEGRSIGSRATAASSASGARSAASGRIRASQRGHVIVTQTSRIELCCSADDARRICETATTNIFCLCPSTFQQCIPAYANHCYEVSRLFRPGSRPEHRTTVPLRCRAASVCYRTPTCSDYFLPHKETLFVGLAIVRQQKSSQLNCQSKSLGWKFSST